MTRNAQAPNDTGFTSDTVFRNVLRCGRREMSTRERDGLWDGLNLETVRGWENEWIRVREEDSERVKVKKRKTER